MFKYNMTTIVVFFIVLYSSIILHEVGHLISAKISGVKVREFSIGGGRKLFSFTFNETKYTLNTFITLINKRFSFGASGYCEVNVFSYLKATKLKKILIAGGGIIVHLILFVLSITYFLITRNSLVSIIAWVNLVLIISNLFPNKDNDISRIIKILKNRYKLKNIKFKRKFNGQERFKKG